MHFTRRLRKVTLGVLVGITVLYAGDGLYAHMRKDQFAEVQVSRMYKMKNRWNETEYSVGGAAQQKCVYSIFPHFGYAPCWYLNRHLMQYINIG